VIAPAARPNRIDTPGHRPCVLVIAHPVWEESASRILHGIALYQREHTPWEVHWDNLGQSLADANWFKRQPWDGVISRHTNALQVDACRRLGIPLVDVNNAETLAGLPNVVLDNFAVGQLGGEHFIDRGFRDFAFCGFGNEPWSCTRRDGFRDAVATFGRSCMVFERDYPGTYTGGCTPQWQAEEIDCIARWLLTLPTPIGVMCCNDFRALQVLHAARHASLRVPEDIAVLGANDDEARCELANPPLSSVATNHLRSGYVAAEALDRLMHRQSLEGLSLTVEPVEVVARQSTDLLAVADKKIAAAARFIRNQACEGLNVDAVCRHVGIARTQLEEKFRKYFGRSPNSEIRRVQLVRIRQLLQETDLPLDAISELTGFKHPEYLIVFFKRATGESPGRFRRKMRFQASLIDTFTSAPGPAGSASPPATPAAARPATRPTARS
jgi:LacI family transcriptional regulator